jgi:hypothetical protein
VKVELSTSAPTLEPVWEDISAFVRAFSFQRGRQHELDRPTVGTLSLKIDNRDRRFDPNNASGPYYGNLKPMRRLRLSAVWSGTTFPLIDTLVEEWPMQWPSKTDSIVVLKCVDHLAVFAAGITATWGEELSGARIEHVLDAVGWPFDWPSGTFWLLGVVGRSELGTHTYVGPQAQRAIDVGSNTVAAATLNNTTAIEHIRQVSDVERGNYYVAKDGSFVWKQQISRYINTEPVAEFGETPGTLPYQDIVVSQGIEWVINSSKVTVQGGSSYTASDATSQVNYFLRPKTLTLPIGGSSPGLVAQDIADELVYRYKDPVIRASSMTIKPARDPDTLWPVILGRELGDRIKVNRQPPGGGALLTFEVTIEAIRMEASPRDWTVTWSLAPADRKDYWVMGVVNHAEMGVNTRIS